MASRRASDVFVDCLEAEGVRYVFGIPGEETLDLNESLADSSIEFVPVRHEQGGAYMADVYGRLTGRAGVCLGTLGPGATNLMTAVADAYLDRAPLVALTGQGDLERMHKESHQYIDVVRMMQPITKWNVRVSDPHIIPEVVRKAFKVAETEKPGATHIELPEDVMADDLDAVPIPRRKPVQPEPAARELLKAADLIRGALNPVALAGNGVIRGRAAPALREFVRATGIPVAETFMGKGAMDPGDPTKQPTLLLKTLYPVPYHDLVVEQAMARNIDPLVLYALMRQESQFVPDARSGADARGLAQIIPSTGQGIADQLGDTNYSVNDLYLPYVSIRYGTYYLTSNMPQFDRKLLPTLAAYNAGPGNAARWLQGSALLDPDLFSERVDLFETSDYLEVVYDNYGFYKLIYAK